MENTRAKTTRNSLILLLTATIWGMAFVSQSKGMDYMHPFTFNGVRSLIGAAGILVYILISRKIAGDKATKLDWKLNVRAGLLCGIFLTIASTLQQFGIKYTSVGKAGFITTLYIIFVPMFGIFLKKKVAPVVWAAAGMAAVGMYLLCMTESLRLGAGDIMVFLCAIAFAIQIMTVVIMQRESMERWYPVSSSQCAASSAASGHLSGDSRLSDRSRKVWEHCCMPVS